MSEIDPEKLGIALRVVDACRGVATLTITEKVQLADAHDTVMAAARAHLATLPRYKEVEVVQWATFDGHDVHRVFDHEDAADADASDINSGLVVVRLTGTAKVKVTP